MTMMLNGPNLTDQEAVLHAWQAWSGEVGKVDFGQRFDVWVATRPQWRYLGCAWSGDCPGGIGRVLSCMFWDGNNKGSLGAPDI
jgi:hypothetical protein